MNINTLRRFLQLEVYLSALFLFCQGLYASPITLQLGNEAANRFFQQRFPQQSGQQLLKQAFPSIFPGATEKIENSQGETIGYVTQFDPGGFVLVRADTLCPPIKLYSSESTFSALPYTFKKVIFLELEEELHKVQEKLPLTQQSGTSMPLPNTIRDYSAAWSQLFDSPNEKTIIEETNPSLEESGIILVPDKWNQNSPYNYYAPAADGPGGRAWAGCVATAMSMILHYHQMPAAILQDHTYTDASGNCIGTHSASQAGLTSYRWADMPQSLTDASPLTQRQAVAQLIYHCGMAVDMDYGGDSNDGSGADPSLVPDAFANYFNYSSSKLLNKNDYPATVWFNMIKTDIDAKRPIFWGMYASGGGGHAVVCDGYRNTSEIHLNLGWSGSCDAWYNEESAISANGYTFVKYLAVFQIAPKTVTPTSSVLNVASSGVGSPIEIAIKPCDIVGDGNGLTPFKRQYLDGITVYMTAPLSIDGSRFSFWQTPSGNINNNSMSLVINGGQTYTAVYNTAVPPMNDNFVDAATIYMNGLSDGACATNVAATTEIFEPAHAGMGPYKTVWWTFVPLISGSLDVNTHGSSFNTVSALYQGTSLSTLQAISSNDDDGSSGKCSGFNNVSITANQRYYIAVGGASENDAGTIYLNWNFHPNGDTLVLNSGSYFVPDGYISIPYTGGMGEIEIIKLSGTGSDISAFLSEGIDKTSWSTITPSWATITAGGGPPLIGSLTVTVATNTGYDSRTCDLGFLEVSHGNTIIGGHCIKQEGRPRHPDFIVESVFMNPANPAPGDVVSIEARIANQGALAGAAGPCAIQLDDALSPGMFVDVGSLNTNESRSVFLRFDAPNSGEHILHVIANSLSETLEENEGNNISNVVFNVQAKMPSVIQAPHDADVYENNTAIISVVGAGTEPLTYQWQHSGTNIVDDFRISGAKSNILTIANVVNSDSGEYLAIISNAAGSVRTTGATLTVKNAMSFAEALNATNITWTSGGNKNWIVQKNITHDGKGAVQSGPIADNQESWLETTVIGPGLLTFWWKVSCEDGVDNDWDWLRFNIDGDEQFRIDGDTDWEIKIYNIGTGTHHLNWLYHKDRTGSNGLDAGWLDQVCFLPDCSLLKIENQGGFLSISNGILRMRAVGQTNVTVIWESSTNLLTWKPWFTNDLVNGYTDVQAPVSTNGQVFYRLRLP